MRGYRWTLLFDLYSFWAWRQLIVTLTRLLGLAERHNILASDGSSQMSELKPTAFVCASSTHHVIHFDPLDCLCNPDKRLDSRCSPDGGHGSLLGPTGAIQYQASALLRWSQILAPSLSVGSECVRRLGASDRPYPVPNGLTSM